MRIFWNEQGVRILERGFGGSRSKSANTLHKHICAQKFYFVLEGVGRMRVGTKTLTVPKYGGVLLGPGELRQLFNNAEAEALWLIVGAPEETEFLPCSKTKTGHVTHLSG